MSDLRSLQREHEQRLHRAMCDGLEDALFGEGEPQEVRWHWCSKHNMQLDVDFGYYSRCSECMKQEVDDADPAS